MSLYVSLHCHLEVWLLLRISGLASFVYKDWKVTQVILNLLSLCLLISICITVKLHTKIQGKQGTDLELSFPDGDKVGN